MFLVACKPEITKAQFDEAMKAQQEAMDNQTKSIKRVVRTQGETIRQLRALLAEPIVNGVVSKLAAASAGGVVVSNVSVASNAGRKITIKGHASSKKKIATLVSGLQRNPMIDKVYLAKVNGTKVGGKDRQAFEITAKYVATPGKRKNVNAKKDGVSKKDMLMKKKAMGQNKKGPPQRAKRGAPGKAAKAAKSG